jgi:hypothetical protein
MGAARMAPWKYGDRVAVDQHVTGQVEVLPPRVMLVRVGDLRLAPRVAERNALQGDGDPSSSSIRTVASALDTSNPERLAEPVAPSCPVTPEVRKRSSVT